MGNFIDSNKLEIDKTEVKPAQSKNKFQNDFIPQKSERKFEIDFVDDDSDDFTGLDENAS